MSVLSTIKYNGTTIVDKFEESSDTVAVQYKGSTVQTFSAGDDKKLNVKDKVLSDYITIGSKKLNTKDKYMVDYVECIVENAVVYLPVGGRIFYDDGDNGATYIFYDASYNVLPTQTVAGLANAVYYSVTGTPTKDRWYVYDNTTDLVSDKTWGKKSTSCGMTSNTIGSGKTNTATMMTLSPDGTLWTWLRDTINANSVGGCSDWFIASKAEQDQLRASGLVNWYSSRNIWSSVEYSANYVYYWRYDRTYWSGAGKSNYNRGFAARAF